MPSLLWVDAGAGLLVGVLVLLFSPWLSTLYPCSIKRVTPIPNAEP